MSTFYDSMASLATGLMQTFAQGNVVLTRFVREDVDADTPWEPGTTRIERKYRLSAIVSGVAKKYVDGVNVVASDMQITLATTGVNVLTEQTVSIIPQMTDTFSIDGGEEKKPKAIIPLPAAGTPSVYLVLVAS